MPRRGKPVAAPADRPENRRKPVAAPHASGIVGVRDGDPCARCGFPEALRHPDGRLQCAGCGAITATS